MNFIEFLFKINSLEYDHFFAVIDAASSRVIEGGDYKFGRIWCISICHYARNQNARAKLLVILKIQQSINQIKRNRLRFC